MSPSDLFDALSRSFGGFLSRFALAGILFTTVAMLARRASPNVRTHALIVASVGLLALLATPLVALIVVVQLIVLYAAVEHLPAGIPRSTLVPTMIALQALTPILLLPLLPGYEGRAREYTAFATNLVLLRTWGYAYDRLRRPEPGRPTLADYLLHQLFLPTFVNGPLISHSEFRRRRVAGYWEAGPPTGGVLCTLAAERWACWRVLRGVLLGNVAAFVVHAPEMAHYRAAIESGGVAAWSLAARAYIWWYVSFLAWIDVAIGLGRLAGFELPENFDRPSFSYGAADFWRRWNITLMRWVRSYIYLPLGGAFLRGRGGERHLEWRNTVAVFLFVAAYHLLGALKLLGPTFFGWSDYVPWFLWALLNSVAVLATRDWKRPKRLGVVGYVVIGATLAFACVGHMTALVPPGVPLADLGRLYRGLCRLF